MSEIYYTLSFKDLTKPLKYSIYLEKLCTCLTPVVLAFV